MKSTWTPSKYRIPFGGLPNTEVFLEVLYTEKIIWGSSIHRRPPGGLLYTADFLEVFYTQNSLLRPSVHRRLYSIHRIPPGPSNTHRSPPGGLLYTVDPLVVFHKQRTLWTYSVNKRPSVGLPCTEWPLGFFYTQKTLRRVRYIRLSGYLASGGLPYIEVSLGVFHTQRPSGGLLQTEDPLKVFFIPKTPWTSSIKRRPSSIH